MDYVWPVLACASCLKALFCRSIYKSQLNLSIGLDALCREGFRQRLSHGVVAARATSLGLPSACDLALQGLGLLFS
jgi:hypothetical protein